MNGPRSVDLAQRAAGAYPAADPIDRAAKVAEEAGELLKATFAEHRPRQYGKRRSYIPAPRSELADVLVAAFAVAGEMGLDPLALVESRLRANLLRR